jgi:hypothetical protein
MLGDKTAAPHLEELDILSEVCRVCFDAEPRDPETLLRRAFVDDTDAAWRALRDDVLLTYPVSPRLSDVVDVLNRPSIDELRVYVCLLLGANIKIAYRDIDVVSLVERAGRDVYSDDTLTALQPAVAMITPDVAARILETYPHTARAFLTYPGLPHVAMRSPGIAAAMCAHAERLPINQRYPSMALAALFARTGVPVATTVARDTFLRLRKTKFDVRVAAAAAALASFDDDPLVRAMSSVVESMAAHMQPKPARDF